MLCAGWATGANSLKHIDKDAYWREIAAIIEGRFTTPMDGKSAREN
jgi:hypothetical protein